MRGRSAKSGTCTGTCDSAASHAQQAPKLHTLARRPRYGWFRRRLVDAGRERAWTIRRLERSDDRLMHAAAASVAPRILCDLIGTRTDDPAKSTLHARLRCCLSPVNQQRVRDVEHPARSAVKLRR